MECGMMETASVEGSLNADSFAAAYGRGFPRTIRFLSSHCGLRPQEAEEFAQAAWARGWESRGALRDAKALLGWVNSIALNLFRGECRGAWRREELWEHQAPQPSPTAGLEAAQALRACSPRDARLLVSRYVLGYSSAELASKEQLGSIAVRVRLSRARRQVRQALS